MAFAPFTNSSKSPLYLANRIEKEVNKISFGVSAETLAKTTGHIACITDKDTVIAVSGGSKKEFLEQGISEELEKIMDDKENYNSKENNDTSIPITKNDNKERKNNAQVVYPIIADGDVIGTVILLSKDANTKMSEVEQKVVQSAASFLGTQMEI